MDRNGLNAENSFSSIWLQCRHTYKQVVEEPTHNFIFNIIHSLPVMIVAFTASKSRVVFSLKYVYGYYHSPL